MFPLKIVITGLVIFAVMAGCIKKKSSKDKEFATATAPVATTPAASQDIFDEFYKEDSAAKKGAAPVAKSEPVARVQPAVAFSENGRFVVQISTVRSHALANEISAKLTAKGYPAYIAEVVNPTPALSGTYYRIRIGGFTGISIARSFGENTLATEGYEYWVDNRSNDNVGLQGDGMGGGNTNYSSQPATTTDYQSSNSTPAATYQPPVEQPPAVSPATPASSYTPESAAKEFETSPSTATPAKSSQNKSEWGNEGW